MAEINKKNRNLHVLQCKTYKSHYYEKNFNQPKFTYSLLQAPA